MQDKSSLSFSLEHFEWLVHTDRYEEASQALLELLKGINRQYGLFPETFSWHPSNLSINETFSHICTRLAGAITTLFSNKNFEVSDQGYLLLMEYHRWLSLIFSVSAYNNGDHIIRNINDEGGRIDPISIHDGNIKQFCLSYYLDSKIELQIDLLWQCDQKVLLVLFFALLSARLLPTPEAHAKRELLLAWLPDKLKEVENLDFIPTPILHDVYMHASYADLPEKHQIKKSLCDLLRRHLLSQGYDDPVLLPRPERRQKPVMVIITEWFSDTHSVYRTHSRALRALREHFYVHGMSIASAVDEVSKEVFDEFHELDEQSALSQSIQYIREIRPNVALFTGVGMFFWTIALSNLKLAPVQLVGLGHGASTFCPQMDGFFVEEDLAGDQACFSEPIIYIPKDAMPFVPQTGAELLRQSRLPFEQRQKEAFPFELPVRIAVCASIMKYNPSFLTTLKAIETRARVPVQFCFYSGFAQGLSLAYLQKVIKDILPTAEVNPHMAVPEYLNALGSCEMFVNPFPYGNMNGVVDVVRQGLPGVCMKGPEIHASIDAGLFRRLGLPETLIAHSEEDYIQAAVRLAEDTTYREALQKQLLDCNPEQILFEGDASKFAEIIYQFSKAHHAF